jgi:hypothetical protein
MIIPETVNRTDPYETRVAIALSFQRLAPLMSDTLVDPVFEFFVVKEALGDRHGAVRRGMLDAATAIIDLHGSRSVAELMKMFEDYLGRSGPSSETADYVSLSHPLPSLFSPRPCLSFLSQSLRVSH